MALLNRQQPLIFLSRTHGMRSRCYHTIRSTPHWRPFPILHLPNPLWFKIYPFGQCSSSWFETRKPTCQCRLRVEDLPILVWLEDFPWTQRRMRGTWPKYVATRWYRAPEIMLSFQSYTKASKYHKFHKPRYLSNKTSRCLVSWLYLGRVAWWTTILQGSWLCWPTQPNPSTFSEHQTRRPSPASDPQEHRNMSETCHSWPRDLSQVFSQMQTQMLSTFWTTCSHSIHHLEFLSRKLSSTHTSTSGMMPRTNQVALPPLTLTLKVVEDVGEMRKMILDEVARFRQHVRVQPGSTRSEPRSSSTNSSRRWWNLGSRRPKTTRNLRTECHWFGARFARWSGCYARIDLPWLECVCVWGSFFQHDRFFWWIARTNILGSKVWMEWKRERICRDVFFVGKYLGLDEHDGW